MSYEAPLRCDSCGIAIRKKPKAKTPKYCPPCREKKQEDWKAQLKIDRQRRVRGR
jgi:predicted Zn-ribbon and HTH transcriptional regulator